jgi:OmpR family response regulator RpaB
MSTRIGSRGRTKIKLSNIEYSILELLIENAGKKLSRTMILENIWGYTPERYADTRIVDVHISRLRSKIEENRSKPELILTVRGIGYMFQRY